LEKRRFFVGSLAIVAGIILIVAGERGSTTFIGKILEFSLNYLDGYMAEIVSIILRVLTILAALGGITVVLGGLLIYGKMSFFGRFIITIGAGMGILGFAVTIIFSLLQGWAYTLSFVLSISQSLGWIGIIMAIIAIQLSKYSKNPQKN